MANVGAYQLLGRVRDDRPVAVWRGRDLAHARDVALKQVKLTSNDAVVRLRAQARVLQAVSHPDLVDVYGVVEDEESAWLVEAWIDGVRLTDLAELAVLERIGPMEAVGLVAGALSGLAYAHENGIVHGNICPQNLLLDDAGRVRLLDYGLPTSDVAAKYASPEALGGRPISARSDVYAAGSVLRALLDPTKVDPHIAPVLDRATDPDPPARYGDAAELRRALEDAADAADPDWRTAIDLGRFVRTSAPAGLIGLTQPDQSAGEGGAALVGAAVGPSLSVSAGTPDDDAVTVGPVRVGERPERPPTQEIQGDVLSYLDPKARRSRQSERGIGRFLPLIAAVVVIAAIVILIVTRQTISDQRPALAFKGNYDVTMTLATAGVGSDGGQAEGAQLKQTWAVSPSCKDDQCSATVVTATGQTFRLSYANGFWSGDQPMPAVTCPAGSGGGPGAGVYSLLLDHDNSGQRLRGAMRAVYAGCGQASTEAASVEVRRR